MGELSLHFPPLMDLIRGTLSKKITTFLHGSGADKLVDAFPPLFHGEIRPVGQERDYEGAIQISVKIGAYTGRIVFVEKPHGVIQIFVTSSLPLDLSTLPGWKLKADSEWSGMSRIERGWRSHASRALVSHLVEKIANSEIGWKLPDQVDLFVSEFQKGSFAIDVKNYDGIEGLKQLSISGKPEAKRAQTGSIKVADNDYRPYALIPSGAAYILLINLANGNGYAVLSSSKENRAIEYTEKSYQPAEHVDMNLFTGSKFDRLAPFFFPYTIAKPERSRVYITPLSSKTYQVPEGQMSLTVNEGEALCLARALIKVI